MNLSNLFANKKP